MNSFGTADTGPANGPHPPTGPASFDAVVVTVRIPADPEFVPILRAACGQLAPRLGCTLTETADLRLAVDEACGLLLRNCLRLRRGTEGDGLGATFVIDGPTLRITLGMEADAFATPDDDDFGWTILTALVDGFAWRVEESTVQLEIRKTHAGR
jgi:anti-sigma regulatory factor (Ser/Thr protein kinase)